jgi:hypothetical protein
MFGWVGRGVSIPFPGGFVVVVGGADDLVELEVGVGVGVAVTFDDDEALVVDVGAGGGSKSASTQYEFPGFIPEQSAPTEGF